MNREIPSWIFENFDRFSGVVSDHGWTMAFVTYVIMYFIAMFWVESEKVDYQRERSNWMDDIVQYGQLATVMTVIFMIAVPITIVMVDFIIPFIVLALMAGIILGFLWWVRKLTMRKFEKRDRENANTNTYS